MKRIAAILTSLVLVFSLAACGSQQAGTAAGSEAASTASSETASAAQTKTEEQLLAEENDILTANDELWEKVFASMDKNVTQTTLNNNYGDFLMDAVDNAKDQFTEEEYASLKADADKIREIENQITALPQDEATSQSAAENGSTFPQFEGKDLDGNSVDSSLFANNAFTVVNFWFSGCKPCVAELGDLNALNETLNKIDGGFFSPNDKRRYHDVFNSLVNYGDHYMLLADYADYIATQDRVDALWRQPEQWAQKTIRNVAAMGDFSSDRTIREYARDIWHIEPMPARNDQD